jgi:hypothetical protein
VPGDQLDRDDLISGINSVIQKLTTAGQPAGIRIVGGAALALRYFDRRTTADIDAQLRPELPIFGRGLPTVPAVPPAPSFGG